MMFGGAPIEVTEVPLRLSRSPVFFFARSTATAIVSGEKLPGFHNRRGPRKKVLATGLPDVLDGLHGL